MKSCARAGAPRLGFERADRFVARRRRDRQVAVESEGLPVHSGRHQARAARRTGRPAARRGDRPRAPPRPRLLRDRRCPGSRRPRRARGQRRRARARALRRSVPASDRGPSSVIRDLAQRTSGIERLQERARRLRVLDDEMSEPARDRDRLRGQHVGGRRDPQQVGHQEQAAGHRVPEAARSVGQGEHRHAGLAQHRHEPDQRQPDERGRIVALDRLEERDAERPRIGRRPRSRRAARARGTRRSRRPRGGETCCARRPSPSCSGRSPRRAARARCGTRRSAPRARRASRMRLRGDRACRSACPSQSAT